MSSLTKIVAALTGHRRREIDRLRRYPAEVQREQLEYLRREGAGTEYARDFDRLPVVDYEALSPLIDRARSGERDVLWPGKVEWFAKSSGTTDRSKYIPVTRAGLRESHLRGPRDVIALFVDLYPESQVFGGKTLTLGGSRRVEREGETAMTGDLSAILLENTPAWANLRRVPSVETALIPDFEQKVAQICREAVGQDVRAFAGVPSWNLVMMNKVLEYTGRDNILEVWPHMELFVHGGISFAPYRAEYERIIPSPRMKYMETYNASEGFFAIADDPSRSDMLLMLDYGIYYEFLPMSSLGDPSAAVPVEGVRTGVNYAMIITTSNGLWRYMIGDTVEFTSLAPHRIRITGRTKHHINVFGEEVMVGNTDDAVAAACAATGAEVADYTVAPVFMRGREKGAHQWVVEFRRAPESVDDFAAAVDRALQDANSDYAAKRFRDTTLQAPVMSVVPSGTFLRWLSERGRVGGQNKIPRLSNDRTLVEQLLK
jgi:hypothetical protein